MADMNRKMMTQHIGTLGQALPEYAVALSLICIVSIVALQNFGGQINSFLTFFSTQIGLLMQ